MEPGNAVVIAPLYELDGPGLEYRKGQEIFFLLNMPRVALG